MSTALEDLAARVRHLEALETAQVQPGEGPPSHSAAATTFYWDKLNYVLYVNYDGASGWLEIGGGPPSIATAGVRVAITRVACPTATGNYTITTSDLGGLTPKAALFVGIGATTDGTATANLNLSYGAASSAGERWVIANFSEDAQAVVTDCYRRGATDACVMFIDGAGNVDGEADYVGGVANGCVLSWSNAPASAWLLAVVFFAGDALAAQAGNFTLGNQDVEVQVDGIGQEPDMVLLGSLAEAMDDVSHTHCHFSTGVAINKTDTPQYSYEIRSGDNVAAAQLTARISDSYAAMQVDSAGAMDWGCEIGSWDDDGCSAWARGGNSGDDIGYLALSFSGEVDFTVGYITSPTADGQQTVTAPGFESQFVMCGLTHMALFDTGYADDNAGTIGLSMFDHFSNAYCASVQDEDAASPTDSQSLSDDQAVNFPHDDGAAAYAGTLTAITDVGWRWFFTAQPSLAHLWWYMAIGYNPLGG